MKSKNKPASNPLRFQTPQIPDEIVRNSSKLQEITNPSRNYKKNQEIKDFYLKTETVQENLLF